MADAVTTVVTENSTEYYSVHLTNISDGTGESAVVKIDKSTLTASDGLEPASVDIEEIRWNVQGFTYIKLLWDHTTDDVAMLLSGNGYEHFPGPRSTIPLRDPRATGGTGDLLLTTVGHASGTTYDITIRVRKAQD